MKQYNPFFTRIFLLFLVQLLLCNFVHGQQNYIDVRQQPTPDCTGETSKWKEFNANETKILVIPDNISDSIGFYKMFDFIKKDRVTKKESELKPEDFNNALWIYGLIRDFKNWEKFNIPFLKVDNFFEFDGKKYNGESDGFFYISENRLVFSGNSMEQIWKMQGTMNAFYRYMIFENGLLSKLCISDTAIIDTKLILESNYNKILSQYFTTFIDKKFETSELDLDDSMIIDICEKMELPLPDFKINSFLHSNPYATRLFSNFYFMTGCDTLPEDMTFGTVHIDGIHTTGINIGMIKHETFHYIWAKLVGNGTSFMLEGIQEYYQQLLDSSQIVKNATIARKYIEHDITDMIVKGDGQSFWGGPSENNWPVAYNISGLFVKFLIDKKGLDTFKQFYVNSESPQSFVDYYDMEGEELIREFKQLLNEM
jgi:hypothetical protein